MTKIEKENVLEKRIEYWHRSTGYNRMCYKCPFLGSGCRGSQTERWVDCVKRNCYERKNAATRLADRESGKGI